MTKKRYEPKMREIQHGLIEIRYGEEYNEFKITTPERVEEFLRVLKGGFR